MTFFSEFYLFDVLNANAFGEVNLKTIQEENCGDIENS